jgi:hypothetical protein
MVELVRVLVLLQGGFALLSTVEILVAGLSTTSLGPLGPSVLLTAATTGATFALVAGLGRRSHVARWLVMAGEAAVIVSALVDLGLAVFLAGTALGLVPTLTRLALPTLVIVLLRRDRVPAGRVRTGAGG